jgi:hypothetical protein
MIPYFRQGLIGFGKFLQLYRPFVVPEGVFDTKRLISDE